MTALARTAAVIVAAGRGTRMGPGVDKLFLEVAGRPVVAHTWARFEAVPEIDAIVVVVREGMQATFEELAAACAFRKPWRLVAGGAERQDSVRQGVEGCPPGTDWVAIHDGARPCTSAATIIATVEAARRVGAAVTAQRVTDTLKEGDAEGRIVRTVDRSTLWSVQTPQVFRRDVLLRGLDEVRRRGMVVTDDTAACEWIGQPVELVEARAPNPKVTVPADLGYVGWLLAAG